jgi:hypothetical protein
MDKRKEYPEQPDEQGQQHSKRRRTEFTPLSRTGNTSTAERGSEALQGHGEVRARPNVSETGEASSQRQNQESTNESIKDFHEAEREEIERKIKEGRITIQAELDKYQTFSATREERKTMLSYSKQTIIDAIKGWPYDNERWAVYQQFTDVIKKVLFSKADDFIKDFFISERYDLLENIKNIENASFPKKWKLYAKFINCVRSCTSGKVSDKIAEDLLTYATRDIQEFGKKLPSYHQRLEFYLQIMNYIKNHTSNELSDKVAENLFIYEARDIKGKAKNMPFYMKLAVHQGFINYAKNAFFNSKLANSHINDLLSYEKWCIVNDTNNKFYDKNYLFHKEIIRDIKIVLPEEWSDEFLKDLFYCQISNILENTKKAPFNDKWNIYNNFIEHTKNVIPEELANEVNNCLLERIINIINEYTLKMPCEEKWAIYDQYINKVEKTFLRDPEHTVSSQKSEADSLEKLRRKHQPPSSSLIRSLLEEECKSMKKRVRLIADSMTSNDFWDIKSMLIKRSQDLLPPSTAVSFINQLFSNFTKENILENTIGMAYDKRFMIYNKFLAKYKDFMGNKYKIKDKYELDVKEIFGKEIYNVITDMQNMSSKNEYKMNDLYNNLCEIHNLFREQVESARFSRKKKEYFSGDVLKNLMDKLLNEEKSFIKKAKDIQYDKRWCLIKVVAEYAPLELRKELYSTEAEHIAEVIRNGGRVEPKNRWALLRGFAELVPPELRADILTEPYSAEAEHVAEMIRNGMEKSENRWALLRSFAELVPPELRADILKEPYSAEAEHIAEMIRNGGLQLDQQWSNLQDFKNIVHPELRQENMSGLYGLHLEVLLQKIQEIPQKKRSHVRDMVKSIIKEMESDFVIQIVIRPLCGKSADEQRNRISNFRDTIHPELRQEVMPNIYSQLSRSIVSEMLAKPEELPLDRLQGMANLVIEEMGLNFAKDLYCTEAEFLMKSSENKPAEEQWSTLRTLRASVPSEWRVEILPVIYLQEGEHTKNLLAHFGNEHLIDDQKFDKPGPQTEHEKEMGWYIISQMQESPINRYSYMQKQEYQVRLQELREWTIHKFEEWRLANELALE